MANHYVAGWDIDAQPTLAEAMAEAYAQFRELRKVAATRNVLLPVGHDHTSRPAGAPRSTASGPKRYVWPRFVDGPAPRLLRRGARASWPSAAVAVARRPGT